jgi:hypothetical protein
MDYPVHAPHSGPEVLDYFSLGDGPRIQFFQISFRQMDDLDAGFDDPLHGRQLFSLPSPPPLAMNSKKIYFSRIIL